MVEILDLTIATNILLDLLHLSVGLVLQAAHDLDVVWLGSIDQQLHHGVDVLAIKSVDAHVVELLPVSVLLNCEILFVQEAH